MQQTAQNYTCEVSGREQEDEPPSRKEDEPPSPQYHPQLFFSQFFEFSPSPPQPLSVVPQHQSVSKTQQFRRIFYPSVSDAQWNSWNWQVRNRICTPAALAKVIDLSPDEQGTFTRLKTKLPLGITPYYASLVTGTTPDHPLRRAVVPTVHEFFRVPGEENDPLNEEGHTQLPGLVHRYPDRALFLVSGFCAVYCRYCTRSRLVGRGNINPSRARLEKAIDYIRRTPAIRDVLLSGGDPLTLSDTKLDWILSRIREIPHVEIIRIGTKTPAVLPQRITPELVKVLRKYHPLWMSLHFTHPEECTPEAYAACERLADAGIPLGSQTVLLKGINDNIMTMKALMHHLMKMRVKPYYLYQCDPVVGSSHFRTPVAKGLELIRGLRGHTSGYAVPTYVIDAPGGGGKIPLLPNYVVQYSDTELLLQNYENKVFHYPNTVEIPENA